jgi:hypothetical protein
MFPIDEPVMPEARQIGRGPSIDRLERKLTSPSHVWLIGKRRIGKTSVAKAVFARSRATGSLALEVDLSRPGINSARALAGDLARQAQAAGAGTESAAQRLGRRARKERKRVKDLGEILDDFGFGNAAGALSAASSLLAGADDGAPGLDRILQALALHAAATGRRVWVLLDEVHHLADLELGEQTISRWCREQGAPLIFLLSGSEESAIRALRTPGRPLAAIGADFELADIAPEDWVPGLRARFEEAGLTIATEELVAVIDASGGHPRRTMMIAARINDSASAQPDSHADSTLVGLAIREAERDRSWS